MKHPLIAYLLPLTALLCAPSWAQSPESPTIPAVVPSAETTPALALSVPTPSVPESSATPTPELSLSGTSVATLKPVKIAFLLPPKDSPYEPAAQLALKGLLAQNYSQTQPSEIILIRPDRTNSAMRQLQSAANAGALIAIGTIERDKVNELSKQLFLPLPVVTLNQVELNIAVPLTEEQKAAKKLAEEAKRLADSAQRELNEIDSAAIGGELASEESLRIAEEKSGRIAARSAVPGLVLAEDREIEPVHYEPRKFPRDMLMMGLSMEDDAEYIARLGVEALPRLTDSGARPKVLLLDHDTPLERRISAAFERSLIEAGFAPDRLTIDTKEFRRIRQFFDLVVEEIQPTEFDEVPIDQELDPVGWRQQQLRLRKIEAAKRARAALAEPPYYAVFLALDASVASLVRSRLPIRSRVWGTPAVYPGDPEADPKAMTLSYDLRHVGLVDCPLVIDFNPTQFEETYHVPAPKSTFEKRLFALGADAFLLALNVSNGIFNSQIDGLTGHLAYDLSLSPKVERTGATAMITGGKIRPMSAQELVQYQATSVGDVRPTRRLKAQSRSLERLEKEAEAAATKAGTVMQRGSSLEIDPQGDFHQDEMESIEHEPDPTAHPEPIPAVPSAP